VAGLSTNVTYYFTVVVYSATGQQGPPSNEIQYVLTAAVPGNSGPPLYAQVQANGANAPALMLSFQGSAGSSYGVQATQDFINWVTVWTTNCTADVAVSYTPADGANYPCRFYRLVSQ
jgi:predicted secreted Zn-dependent protease